MTEDAIIRALDKEIKITEIKIENLTQRIFPKKSAAILFIELQQECEKKMRELGVRSEKFNKWIDANVKKEAELKRKMDQEFDDDVISNKLITQKVELESDLHELVNKKWLRSRERGIPYER